jgi:two-component system sensor histidine kinase KdpD
MNIDFRQPAWLGYVVAIGASLICTGLGLAMAPRFDIVNIAMVYLLAVVLVALTSVRGAAILCSILCVLLFDVVFVPPRGTLTVDDTQYLLTFVILLLVALIISNLNQNLQAEVAAKARLEVEAETERLRNTLLASISHDLRTPLAVMMGASSTLATRDEQLSSHDRVQLARSIFDQSRELTGRITKLLQMTRLEVGDFPLAKDWVAMDEILASVLSTLAGPLESYRVVLDLPADLPLVYADASMLEQVLSNLLENVTRHTPTGTLISVGGRTISAHFEMEISDRGPGIQHTELNRVFEKFHRQSTQSGIGGVGLGLTICRAIIELHGGRIWAQSELRKGTTIRFTIPRSEPLPSRPSAEPS